MKFLLALLLAFATATVFLPGTWLLQIFQIGAYLLAYILLGTRFLRPPRTRLGWICIPILCIPLWGLLQLAAHTTSSTAETRAAILRWGALSAIFLLSSVVAQNAAVRRSLLDLFVWFAMALAILCLAQLFTSQGRVLWLFDTGHDEVYGTFPYHNNYAQFVELALPIALWGALRHRRLAIWYALAGGVLYASVIGCTSRAGTVLCTLELLAVLVIGLVRLRNPETGSSSRKVAVMLAIVPLLAIVFTLAVGWQRVWERFQQHDPYIVRREFLIAAVNMAKQRPLTGFGLGTFPAVYQRYAIRDFPFYANHAHDDWAEFAADGGVPFLLLVLCPFALAVPAAIRQPWALGLLAVMLHACVDYPFPRPAVSGWMFALLGMLYACRGSNHKLAAGSTPPPALAS